MSSSHGTTRRKSLYNPTIMQEDNQMMLPLHADTSSRSYHLLNTPGYSANGNVPRRTNSTNSAERSASLSQIEKSFNMEESQSEALFNHLKHFTIDSSHDPVDSQYSKLKSKFWSESRKSSQDSHMLSLLSSQRRSSVYSTGNPESTASSIMSIASTGPLGKRSIHRRSRDFISLPIAMGLEDGNSKTKSHVDETSGSTRVRAENLLASLDAISKDTKEQIRRNSAGTFSSLLDFVEKNGVEAKRHVFAHCPETGDIGNPVINLETGIWEKEKYDIPKVTRERSGTTSPDSLSPNNTGPGDSAIKTRE
ncbi:HDR033Cp [Eremothecium sinecaudum]|uniref:HDR033Cp n=1 Tax=Eremothecium sinecaudum TaxID=45286 RepID=A0A120K289_9SACH|nr:HDR033Cp [Eremothecium sinecaudum]AMD20776.1 HDR033Cp [Eremothecium sinecaudum]